MLIDSKRIGKLLDSGVKPALDGHQDERQSGERESYRISTNPIPALMIFLLGSMMSYHHHHSRLSTKIHRQWGGLIMFAGLARGTTHFLFYLSPPRSIHPSRPPTEIIAALTGMGGGLLAMISVSLQKFEASLYML